jgi:hypothetical protein
VRSRVDASLVATALLASVVALVACSPGGLSTSHAEQVDVPIIVRLRLDPERDVACRRDHCRIHFLAAVTTDSETGVWARNCSVSVLDGDGASLATSAMELGFPAGLHVQAGTISRTNGGVEIEIAKRRWDRIRSLRATCRAYEWHGEPPI